MSPEHAQVIALQALAWLAGNEELCPIFLGSTGCSIDDIREQATDLAFQSSILEFLTMDDAWVIAFCDAHDLKYDTLLRARYAMPGSENVNYADY